MKRKLKADSLQAITIPVLRLGDAQTEHVKEQRERDTAEGRKKRRLQELNTIPMDRRSTLLHPGCVSLVFGLAPHFFWLAIGFAIAFRWLFCLVCET